MMRIRLVRPNKEKFFRELLWLEEISNLEKIQWAINSEFDITFYREDGDTIVEITKRGMQIALDNNWEMRG